MNELEYRSACELRATSQGDEMVLSGYAARFGSISKDLGGFRETVQKGAFSRSLASDQDVVCLFNHSENHVLGRRSAGTLLIGEDASGLRFRCQLDPNNTEHRNLHASVKRGDVNQCSFAFTVNGKDGCSWEDQQDERGTPFVLRTLKDVNLFDVSAVTQPAYSGTSVSARAQALRFSAKLFRQSDTDLRVKATRQQREMDEQRMRAIQSPSCRAVKMVDGHFERDFAREEEMREEERGYNHQLASELFPQYWN